MPIITPGAAGRPVGLDGAGQPEVGDLHHTVVGQQDVLGLDVSVDEPGPMRDGERGQDGLHDGDGLGGAEPAAFAQQVAQGAAADEFHDQEDVAVVFALVVDGDRVDVGQLGRGPGLAGEPVGEGRVARAGPRT